jgi:hypothetical protein
VTSPDFAVDTDLQRAFLVERYLSPTAAVGLTAGTARVTRQCADVHSAGTDVRYLYSAYLPSEDTCFCLFSAVSSEAVRAVNDLAGFPLDRITEATLLVGSVNSPSAPTVSRTPQ